MVTRYLGIVVRSERPEQRIEKGCATVDIADYENPLSTGIDPRRSSPAMEARIRAVTKSRIACSSITMKVSTIEPWRIHSDANEFSLRMPLTIPQSIVRYAILG